MKIAINHTRFASTGGVERYLYNLVNHLLDAGHEIHYYCYKWEPFSHPRMFFHRVPYIKGIRFLKILSFAFFSKLMLQKEKFDLILGFGKTYYQDIYRDGTGCLKDYQKYSLPAIKNPVRRFFRKISPYQQVIQAIETRRYKPGNFTKIIANSQFVKNQILHRHNLHPNQVEVVYSGSDCKHFTPDNRTKYRREVRKWFEIDQDDFLILFVGNDFMRKGLDTILKAIPDLLKVCPHLKALIVGKDRHEKKFKKLALSLGIENEVIFAGHHPDTSCFYAAADIFALPSRFDPFPNAVLEAMASGLPVIVTEMSGAYEVVDGSGLVLKNPESETELVSKIMILLDERLRTKMGINARKKAESLSWDIHMERMLRIYKEVYEKKMLHLSSQRQSLLNKPNF
jgi:UDP-glucose:(heptosyl)LPS alpha-1,3-glucosyltransferase